MLHVDLAFIHKFLKMLVVAPLFLSIYLFGADPIRIMPLGDSITYGADNSIGAIDASIAYRGSLWTKLSTAGYNVDFVGSIQAGSNYQIFDPSFDLDNEGYWGWRADQIASNITEFLTANPADIILLHIGTNDLNQGQDIISTVNDVETILNHIYSFNTNIKVIIARIINQQIYDLQISDYNDALEFMVQNRIANGDNLMIVDMEDDAGIDYAADMLDNYHPNTTGYDKVADQWYLALTTLLPAGLYITTDPVTSSQVNVPYFYDVNSSDDPSAIFVLNLSPSWMYIDTDSGHITGIPDAVGNFEVEVEAMNDTQTDIQNYILNVIDTSVYPSNLDHYWKLDETAGSPYLDSYLGADGTCTGGGCPVSVTGKVNGAQSFDGNDEIDVTETATFNWAADDSFSIEFWIKTNTDTVNGKNNTIMGRKSGSNDTSLAWFISIDSDNSGKILFGLSDSNDGWDTLYSGTAKTRGITVVKDDVWHHIVCVRDAINNENRIYVDGVLDGTKSITYDADFNEGVEPVDIGYLNWDWGSNTGGYHYQGLLDEIAVFNTALSQAEIEQHYNDGLAGNGIGVGDETDTTPPVITRTGAANVSITQGTAYEDEGATASDNIDGDITANIIISNLVDVNTIGTYIVTYDVNDTAGNAAAQVTRTVEVTIVGDDTTPPVITRTGAANVSITQGTAYEDEGATASDNIDGDITPNIIISNLVDVNTIGTYIVTYDVNDTAGNAAAQVTRTVEVTAFPTTMEHYWKLDETAGSPYLDSYLGADGTCTGGGCPVSVTGKVNGAQSFDGNDEIDVTETATFNWAADDSFSIEFWIKTNTDTVNGKNNTIMGRKSGSNDTSLAWFISIDSDNSGKILFGLSDSNDGWDTLYSGTAKTRGITVVKDDVWHHIVCVRDAINNENRIYVDGVLDGTKSITYDADFNEGVEPVDIGYLNWDWGSNTGGYHYQGLLDEIAVFNTALSQAEIEQHYNDGLAGNGIGVGDETDTTPPVITRTGAANVSITQGTAYEDEGATASDNIDGDITANIIISNLVDVNTIGTYIVTYDVNDTAGNAAAQVTRTVEVTIVGDDTTPPVITRTGAANVSITQGTAYEDEGATASDNIDGDITPNIIISNLVDVNTIGTYIVTYDVNDTAGNTAAQVTRTVEVTAFPTTMEHYWKLDETAGSPYLDSYLGADGTCTGGGCPVSVTGKVNGAQSFDGNDEIDVTETATFNWAADDSFSIEFWIKTNTDTVNGKNNTIMGRKSGSNDTSLAWFISIDSDNSGKILFGLSDSNDGWDTLYSGTAKTRGITVVKDDVWHHIVCVRDAINNENRIYVDGVLDGTKSITYDADFNEGVEPVDIGYLNWDWGSNTGGYHYQGLLDEIAVFNTALSQAEIEQHYNDGLAGNGISVGDDTDTTPQ